MTRDEIKNFIMAILGQVDYDIQKSYDPEMAEEPEYAKENMERLITFADKYLKKLEKKNVKKSTKK